MIDGLHFLRPYWLLLLPLAGLLLWLIIYRQRRTSTWRSLCDPQLLQAQLQGGSETRYWLPYAILGSAWTLAIVALAGPAWQQQEVPVYNRLDSRVILFDLSRSMDSNDLLPSRLTRARYKLNDLVNGAGARQQSLVVFAGDSFVVSPFTDDRDTLVNLIPALTTDTVPVQGSRADKALNMAMELINNAGVHQVQIVLITDGVDSRSMQIARQLAERGHKIDVIGAGTTAGAPVALTGGGLLKDSDGNIVVPGMDPRALRELAANGNGRYFDLAADGSDVEWLNRREPGIPASGRDDVEGAVTGSSGTLRWLDNGIWLLLPLALLASFGFRRGALLVVILGISMPGQEAMAFGWADLWQRADQQAYQALQNDQPDAVPGQSPPQWRGAAAYRQQDFAAAGELFAEGSDADSTFNKGNALAYSGQLEQAVAAYQQALELDPEMEDARQNLELVKSLLDQQQPRESTGQSPQQGENSDQQADTQPGQSWQDESEQSQGEQQNRPGELDNGVDNKDNNQVDNRDLEKQNEDNGNAANTEPGSGTPSPRKQGQPEESQSAGNTESGPMSEDQQSLQQWLKQVPDDPGGLLRRKFRYQYSRRPTRATEADQW